MSHPYFVERIIRTRYVMRSGERLLELLDRSDVQGTLGVTALKLKVLTEDAYVPTVGPPLQVHYDDIIGESHITLRHENRDRDNVPLVAVRPGETLTRDPYFFLPTPRQKENAAAIKTDLPLIHPADHLDGLSWRYVSDVANNTHNIRKQLDTTPLAKDEYASCQALTVRQRRPLEDVTTTLRFRPLVLMRINLDLPHVPLGSLAQALMQAEQVLENPAYVTEGNGYESLEQAWFAEAQAIGAHVARFADEQQ